MIETKDGLKLFTRAWEINDAVANVYIVHGFVEHSGRYNEIASFFNRHGCSVYAYDLRGHGKSEGEKPYIKRFTLLDEDMSRWMDATFTAEKPSFLFGHSLGGLVICSYLIRKKPRLDNLKAVMMTGPALMIHRDIAPFLQKIAPIVGEFVPKMTTLGLDGEFVSKDPAVVAAYRADPLVYHKKSHARSGWEIMKTMKYVQDNASDFSYPVYIAHGLSDKLTEPDGSKKFYSNISSSDKTLKLYDGLYHEIFNEPERDIFYNDLENWFVPKLETIEVL